MKVGVTCARFTWPGGDPAIAEKFATAARGSEEVGLASFWVMDHHWQIASFGAPEEPMLEAYTALSYAAALTSRIALGALVTGVTYREPGILIKQVSTLDVLSGGRAVLGLGAGWYEAEHRGLGFQFPPLAERFERLEEVAQIARQMWSDSETAHIGKHYQLGRTLNSPQVLSRPHPPILIGGGGERKTLRLVALYANACNLFDRTDVRRKLETLRQHCERLDRPYEAIEKTLHMRLGANETVDDTARRCRDFATMGISHVIVAMRDAAAESSLMYLAELAAKVADI